MSVDEGWFKSGAKLIWPYLRWALISPSEPPPRIRRGIEMALTGTLEDCTRNGFCLWIKMCPSLAVGAHGAIDLGAHSRDEG